MVYNACAGTGGTRGDPPPQGSQAPEAPVDGATQDQGAVAADAIAVQAAAGDADAQPPADPVIAGEAMPAADAASGEAGTTPTQAELDFAAIYGNASGDADAAPGVGSTAAFDPWV